MRLRPCLTWAFSKWCTNRAMDATLASVTSPISDRVARRMCGDSLGCRWRRADNGMSGNATRTGRIQRGPTTRRLGRITYRPTHDSNASDAGQRGSGRGVTSLNLVEANLTERGDV